MGPYLGSFNVSEMARQAVNLGFMAKRVFFKADYFLFLSWCMNLKLQ